MKLSFVRVVFALTIVLWLPGVARGADIVESIGIEHWTSGTILTTSQFTTAVGGQPAPFNAFIGSDVSGPNFSASWDFVLGIPTGATVTGATLTLGIYDHDSKAPGNQVASFTVGSTDLTSLLNIQFESFGGANAEYDVYTITLPSAAFATLQSGSASFALSLQGPGLGILGTTPFNGAGLDFSTLDVTTASPTPEPGTAWLLLSSVPGLIALRRRLGKTRGRNS